MHPAILGACVPPVCVRVCVCACVYACVCTGGRNPGHFASESIDNNKNYFCALPHQTKKHI